MGWWGPVSPESLKAVFFIKPQKGSVIFFWSTKRFFNNLPNKYRKSASTVLLGWIECNIWISPDYTPWRNILVDLRRDNIEVLFVDVLDQPRIYWWTNWYHSRFGIQREYLFDLISSLVPIIIKQKQNSKRTHTCNKLYEPHWSMGLVFYFSKI